MDEDGTHPSSVQAVSESQTLFATNNPDQIEIGGKTRFNAIVVTRLKGVDG